MFLLKKLIQCYNRNVDMKFFVKEDLSAEITNHLSIKEHGNKYAYESPIRSVTGTFLIDKFVIARISDTCFHLEITFIIPKTYIEASNITKIKSLKSITECVEHLMEIIWEYRPCRECLVNLTTDKYCDACSIYNVVNQHGLSSDKITEIPVCTICLEEVLHSRLHCGHHFHAACLIQVNPKPYLYFYEESEAFKCPNCRDTLDLADYDRFFLYEETDSFEVTIEEDEDGEGSVSSGTEDEGDDEH